MVVNLWQEVAFQHVYREGSNAVDLLANMEVQSDDLRVWKENYPQDLLEVIYNDHHDGD